MSIRLFRVVSTVVIDRVQSRVAHLLDAWRIDTFGDVPKGDLIDMSIRVESLAEVVVSQHGELIPVTGKMCEVWLSHDAAKTVGAMLFGSAGVKGELAKAVAAARFTTLIETMTADVCANAESGSWTDMRFEQEQPRNEALFQCLNIEIRLLSKPVARYRLIPAKAASRARVFAPLAPISMNLFAAEKVNGPVRLGHVDVSISDLLHVVPGDVIPLGLRLEAMASLTTSSGDMEVAHGYIANRAGQRALVIHTP